MNTEKKRGENWGVDEEVALIEEEKLRAHMLFGSYKGSGAVKGKLIKEKEWQTIADKLSSRFDTRKRTWEEAKKKYYNVKSRSKEKLDSLKRPKAGGGPPLPPLTQGEETFLRLSEAEPNIHGLGGGVDTDAPIIRSVPSTDTCTTSSELEASSTAVLDENPALTQHELPITRKEKKGEPRRRRLEELEERNLTLDIRRLEQEVLRVKEKREVLQVQKELLNVQKEVQVLKKQQLLLEIQSNYPDLLVQLSSEL